MLSRTLRYSLGRASSRQMSAVAVQATSDDSKVARLDDWENFKMPSAPYLGMGPLPPAPKEIPVEGQSRMVWFPETYFKLLESKLGYTGPYTLFWGSVLFMCSKEWLLLNPEGWWTFTSFIFMGAMSHHLLIPAADRETHITNQLKNKQVELWKEYKMSLSESVVDGAARLKEQTQALNLIQEQRKNNLALGLEAEAMDRQANLVAEVKKRLDYQVTCNNIEREAQSQHMINWIESEVQAALAKRSPKEDLAAAISQLKTMAKA